MAKWLEPQTLILVVLTLLNIGLQIERWVRKRERHEGDTTESVDAICARVEVNETEIGRLRRTSHDFREATNVILGKLQIQFSIHEEVNSREHRRYEQQIDAFIRDMNRRKGP